MTDHPTAQATGPTKVWFEREEYRNYTIWYDPPPIPLRKFDWHFTHVDYDLGDPRHGDGPSVEDCKAQIDELED